MKIRLFKKLVGPLRTIAIMVVAGSLLIAAPAAAAEGSSEESGDIAGVTQDSPAQEDKPEGEPEGEGQ